MQDIVIKLHEWNRVVLSVIMVTDHLFKALGKGVSVGSEELLSLTHFCSRH